MNAAITSLCCLSTWNTSWMSRLEPQSPSKHTRAICMDLSTQAVRMLVALHGHHKIRTAVYRSHSISARSLLCSMLWLSAYSVYLSDRQLYYLRGTNWCLQTLFAVAHISSALFCFCSGLLHCVALLLHCSNTLTACCRLPHMLRCAPSTPRDSSRLHHCPAISISVHCLGHHTEQFIPPETCKSCSLAGSQWRSEPGQFHMAGLLALHQ